MFYTDPLEKELILMNHHYDPHNIFAKILRDEIPVKQITHNTHALSFYDAFPKAPIHALIIPKGAYINMQHFLSTASQEEIYEFWMCVHETIAILRVHKDGFRLISNCGIHGGQEVPHMHVHILAGCTMGPMVSAVDHT